MLKCFRDKKKNIRDLLQNNTVCVKGSEWGIGENFVFVIFLTRGFFKLEKLPASKNLDPHLMPGKHLTPFRHSVTVHCYNF